MLHPSIALIVYVAIMFGFLRQGMTMNHEKHDLDIFGPYVFILKPYVYIIYIDVIAMIQNHWRVLKIG